MRKEDFSIEPPWFDENSNYRADFNLENLMKVKDSLTDLILKFKLLVNHPSFPVLLKILDDDKIKFLLDLIEEQKNETKSSK